MSVLGFAFWLSACASSPLVKTAASGDVKALRGDIDAAKKNGQLTEDEVRDVARALLAGDIERSRDPDGSQLIHSLSSCAAPLESALEERAEKRDETGSEAAILLAERHAYGGECPASFRDAPEGGFRALAALDADDDDDLELRHRFLIDPDPRVRRAAVEASKKARDERDVPLLLEASRVDPDPLVQSRALVALGAFGGNDVVLRLKDRFGSADEAGKLAIVDAWAEPASYEAGGRVELENTAAEAKGGFVAVHAAATLSRLGAPDELGFGRLATFVKDGTTDERRMAIRVLPIDHAGTEAVLVRASADSDESVALLAWVRLYARATSSGGKNDKLAADAEKKLLEWARTKATGKENLAHQARAALAAYGSKDVLPHLTRERASKDADARIVAAQGLIRLRAFQTVAPLLADEDAHVRRTVACQLLTALPSDPDAHPAQNH